MIGEIDRKGSAAPEPGKITLVCYSLHEVGRFHKVQLLV